MKMRILIIHTAIAACLCAVLVSCQDVFSSSPFASLLGRDAYPDFSAMTFQERSAVAEDALSSGNLELAGKILPRLLDDYPGLAAGDKPPCLGQIVQLALLTTRVSKAVADAMNVLPPDGAERTEEQDAAFKDCMSEIRIGSAAKEAFDLLGASGERAVRGCDYLFSGLALIQSVVRGRSEISIDYLTSDELNAVLKGLDFVEIGEARLAEEGYDAEIVSSIGALTAEMDMGE